MSQSDKWLLIYGREEAKLVVASKTALLLFSNNVKMKNVSKKGFWHRSNIFSKFFNGRKELSYK